MATLVRPTSRNRPTPRIKENRTLLRDGLIVTVGGQLERVFGVFTSLALRWWLEPERLGVYNGLRVCLDQTNRSSLGIGLGAVQEIPLLVAQGREAEAERVANVAHTTNTLTCSIYASLLILWAWLRAPSLAGEPLAAEWTWGLVAIAGLALLRRYESFQIALLRARREFTITTKLDLFEAVISLFAIAAGIKLAGFWGLLGAVGFVIASKIAYLQIAGPIRMRWVWDVATAYRLMLAGLPILANTAIYGILISLDRILILGFMPDGERAAGLFSAAALGAGWALDAAGRIATVLYPNFLASLGSAGAERETADRAMKSTETQAPFLAAGCLAAFTAAPEALAFLMPKYAEGLSALRPLIPGSLLLALAWPGRQLLTAVSRFRRLAIATLIGTAISAFSGFVGVKTSGLTGAAWGLSIGYAFVFMITSASSVIPWMGTAAWLRHLGRLGGLLGYHAIGAILSAYAPLGISDARIEWSVRAVVACCWALLGLRSYFIGAK